MIRIRKSQGIPQSLATTKAYDGEDVKRQLLLDQDSKCYLCERLLGTDFEIEHFAGREGNLINDWNNLLLSCGYCNRKKFNGVGTMRKAKEDVFYKYFISKIDYFNELLLQYITDKTLENRDKVLGELGVDREFLGFKYWIIKDNNVEEFYDDIVWNKR